MRLLQRYITLELLRVFVMVLMGVSILLMFVGVFQQASENGLGPMEVLQILPYVLYSLLPITIPATMLLTVTVVYGRMAGDQELIAARAAGISLFSLIWPSLLLGACLSLGSFLLTDQVIPWSVQKIQETVLLKMEKIFLDQLRADHQFIDSKRGVAITVIDVQNKTLIKPTIRYTQKNGQTYTIQAESARIQFDLQEHTAKIRIDKGYIHMADGRSAWIREEEYPFPLPMLDGDAKVRHMAVLKIQEESKELEKEKEWIKAKQIMSRTIHLATGSYEEFTMPKFLDLDLKDITTQYRYHRLTTEFHSRFAMAGSCFFFVLVGSPFSILQARRQFLTSFFMVFVPIITLYYPLVMLAMNQSKSGAVDPLHVMWIANIIVGGIGIYLLRKLMQN